MSNPAGYPCQICDHPKAIKKYNAYVCHACREFFYRHYPPMDIFPCPYNCNISYKKQRQNCRDCRLKKCLDLNMQRDGSDGGRHVVDDLCVSYNSYAPLKKLMEMYGEILNNGFRSMGNLQSCQRVTEWVDCLAHRGRQLQARDGRSPSSVVANTNMSLNDLVMFPGTCIDRSTRSNDIFSKSEPAIPYKLMETNIRIIVAAIENMALVEEFQVLPVIDRLKLVQQNAMMMSTCLLHFIKYSQGWDPKRCAQYLNRFKLSTRGGASSPWKGVVSMCGSTSSARITALMKEVQPTENEFILLRLRSFFRPCVNHSDEGYATIIQIRLKLAYYLGQYIRESNPSFSSHEVQRRLHQLLGLETFLKDVEAVMNSTLAALSAQGSNGFGGPLLYEIFIKQF